EAAAAGWAVGLDMGESEAGEDGDQGVGWEDEHELVDDGVSEDEDQMDGEGGEDGVAGDWGDAEAGGSGDADDGRGEDQVGEADGGEEDGGCGVTEEQAAAGDGAAEAFAEQGGCDGVGDVAGMEHL